AAARLVRGAGACAQVAYRRSPEDRVWLGNTSVEGQDVAGRVEIKLLDHVELITSRGVLEPQPRWASNRGTLGGSATDRIQRAIDERVCLGIGHSECERKRLIPELADDELLRLLVLIEEVFQPPALQPGAAIRKHSNDILCFDFDLALRILPDEGRYGRRGSLARFRGGRGGRLAGRRPFRRAR